MIPKGVVFTTCMVVLISFSTCLTAADWFVDASVLSSGDGQSWGSAFQSIQEGIDAAAHGDTVTVAEGTYVENIHFGGKNIVLRSTDPGDDAVVQRTIIDGNHAGPVVSFAGTEENTCVLSGFTVRNGEADYGGGILGSNAENRTRATIENNTITGNVATIGGGGLYGCDGHIHDNTITSNSTSAYGGGGGVTLCGGTIRDNTITGNLAGYGGGIRECHGTIENNVISGNSAPGSGGGLVDCDGTIQGNTISGNISENDPGGGLANCDGTIQDNEITGNSGGEGGGLGFCNALIQNNRIVGNSAAVGGGLYICNGTIQNNVIVGNSAGDGGGFRECHGTIQNNLIVGNRASFSSGLSWCNATIQNNTIVGGLSYCRGPIRNCILWGSIGLSLYESSEPTYSCIQNWSGGGEGNISEDPLFVDPAGPDEDPNTYEDNDYRLQAESPCIDVGVNFYWFAWPQRDLDGNCRLVGERVDMGCYERGALPDSDGDLLADDQEGSPGTDLLNDDSDGDGLRDGLEILRPSAPLETTMPEVIDVSGDLMAIQRQLCVAVEGDEIIVAPGVYHGNLQFCGSNVILRSSDPKDIAAVTATVLDGNKTGPVVSFTGNESETCILSGFTLRNGDAGEGGGIRGGYFYWLQGTHTRAAIQNNIIIGNAATYGGGVSCCDGLIVDNIIVGNAAENWGGGLAYCDGTVENNIITLNSGREHGGGLDTCNGTIERNLVVGNSAGDDEYRYGNSGGLGDCRGMIQSNLIVGNAAWTAGGLGPGQGVIRNNTIAHNTALNQGGGLMFGIATIYNCIIWGNAAPTGPQIYEALGHQPDMVSYSCVQDWIGGEGNTADDPLFRPVSMASGNWTADPSFDENASQTIFTNDAAGWEQGILAGLTINPNMTQPLQFVIASNTATAIHVWGDATPFVSSGDLYQLYDYRLTAASPCVDTARNEIWMWGAEDLGNNPRVFFGSSSVTVDMGSYEYASWPFMIMHFADNAPGRQLKWKSRPGDAYAVLSCGALPCVAWTEEATVESQGEVTEWTDPDTTALRKFYRIELK